MQSFDTEKYAEENMFSIQVAARELRYDWFKSIIAEQKINWIVTAHHANDNIETLLINFFKGTGISGLRGILPKHTKIIRPLLFAKKEELLAFAKENSLDYVDDSTNASDKYTRNYFRNQLIPSIQKVFPKVEDNLFKSIERFNDIETLYQQSISFYRKKLLEQKGNEIHIPVLELSRSEPLSTIVYEIIKDFGFTSNQTEEVIKLLKSESGKHIQSSTYRIIKNRKWLIISPLDTLVADNILIEEKDKVIPFATGMLKFERLINHHRTLSTDNLIAMLDAEAINFPLLLRKWKQGDYFYPLGMSKKKKLSRFFIDEKLSLTEKENVWVLEMNKKIVWVVGKRIDDRFKLNPNTKNILKISVS